MKLKKDIVKFYTDPQYLHNNISSIFELSSNVSKLPFIAP